MQITLNQRSCVLEPIQCERAVLACIEQHEDFTLSDLEALSNFTDASILFEEIIYLDTHLPSLRHETASSSPDERTKHHLTKNLKWSFFNCEHRIVEYPGSDLVNILSSLRPDEEYSRIKIGRNIYRSKRNEHPVLGNMDWSTFLYLDKVNNAAASLGATVIHCRNFAQVTTHAIGSCHPGLGIDFIKHYTNAEQKHLLKSSTQPYRRTYHLAPFLLSAVLDKSLNLN